jgi:antitoxin (DNA-binding transcriptional repressor) of toxin-antitoxin stability system
MWLQEATLKPMKAVGIRELKNRLSEYVRLVRAGDEILVTDRGEVVAELRPPHRDAATADLHPGLARLARQGRLRPGGGNSPALYPRFDPLTPPGTAKRLLDEERGER